MRKRDLIAQVSTQLGMTQNETTRVIEATLSAIGDALNHHEIVTIRDFGVFSIKTWKERKGRNPLTGQPMLIPSREVVCFKPSNNLVNYSHKNQSIC